jgi:hypothetical protein
MKKIIFLIMISLSSSVLFAQSSCVANFSFDATNPASGIDFYDQSYSIDSNAQINVTSWLWTFYGNGPQLTSSEQNPSNLLFGNQGVVAACLTITTSNGCTSSHCDTIVLGDSLIILNPCSLNVNIDVTPISSNGGADGAIDLTIDGGTAPYIFAWSNGANTEDLASLSAGIYTVHIIDANPNCAQGHYYTVQLVEPGDSIPNDSLIIENPCYFPVDINVTPVSIVGGNDGSIDLTVSGGVAPFTFDWSNGAQTEDLMSLSAGTYTVHIIDSNPNCPDGQYYSIQMFELTDSINIDPVMDTLVCPILDTCLNFIPNAFNIANIQLVDSNTVLVTWLFENNGVQQTIVAEYQFDYFGNQMIVLTLNCDEGKGLTSFYSFANINPALGVENNGIPSFNLYPNPANDQVIVNAKTPYTLTITDLTGREMLNSTISDQTHSISLSDFPNGIYIVTVIQSKTKTSQKLVISK